MSYHRTYTLNADEVATILTLVDEELEDCNRNNIPFSSIDDACSDPVAEEDAVSDVRYLARLGRITQILQAGQYPKTEYNTHIEDIAAAVLDMKSSTKGVR